MARQKTKNLQPKISNQDLEAKLRFVKVSDGYDSFTNELSFELLIKHTDGSRAVRSNVLVDDVLTSPQKTSLNQLLVLLRDAALDSAGYLDE
jgi:hypothetical protein